MVVYIYICVTNFDNQVAVGLKNVGAVIGVLVQNDLSAIKTHLRFLFSAGRYDSSETIRSLFFIFDVLQPLLL